MNIICGPAGIVDRDRPGQGVQDMARAGFEGVLLDMAMYCTPGELENGQWRGHVHGTAEKNASDHERERARENMRENVRGSAEENASRSGQESAHENVREARSRLLGCSALMLEKCRATGLKAAVARAPYLPRDTKQKDAGRLLGQLAAESISLCHEAGCGYLIVRPLSAGIARGDEWRVNRAYYGSLAKAARDSGVMLLLENQCRSMNGHLIRGLCADGPEAAEWVDRLNEEAGEERFGFCMDVGTYSLCGQDMRQAAVSLGKRVKAVILRDCSGEGENAMLPFTGVGRGQSRTDWLGLIRGLREIHYDGELIVDFGDTACAFSPLLRPKLMELAKAVGEYVAWQVEIEKLLKKYSSIVLFGAGNMCRNYMKCYGEKYPPMFTCDNNAQLWGKSVWGLEVKPPESLLGLPEECAVFICNIYYREIEAQLRQMGVRNPIAFFNDEYMPFFPPPER